MTRSWDMVLSAAIAVFLSLSCPLGALGNWSFSAVMLAMLSIVVAAMLSYLALIFQVLITFSGPSATSSDTCAGEQITNAQQQPAVDLYLDFVQTSPQKCDEHKWREAGRKHWVSLPIVPSKNNIHPTSWLTLPRHYAASILRRVSLLICEATEIHHVRVTVKGTSYYVVSGDLHLEGKVWHFYGELGLPVRDSENCLLLEVQFTRRI